PKAIKSCTKLPAASRSLTQTELPEFGRQLKNKSLKKQGISKFSLLFSCHYVIIIMSVYKL
ncbi:MAG: hypothetical protein II093_07160, partial [Selenomonas sp.]|nr:hypothetical protein [Selenomonas sp.]